MSESYIEGNGIRLAYEEFGDPGPGAPAIRAFSRKSHQPLEVALIAAHSQETVPKPATL